MQNILELDYECETEKYLRNVLQGCRQLKPPLAQFFASIEDALDEQKAERTYNELYGAN